MYCSLNVSLLVSALSLVVPRSLLFLLCKILHNVAGEQGWRSGEKARILGF